MAGKESSDDYCNSLDLFTDWSNSVEIGRNLTPQTPESNKDVPFSTREHHKGNTGHPLAHCDSGAALHKGSGPSKMGSGSPPKWTQEASLKQIIKVFICLLGV